MRARLSSKKIQNELCEHGLLDTAVTSILYTPHEITFHGGHGHDECAGDHRESFQSGPAHWVVRRVPVSTYDGRRKKHGRIRL